MRYLLEFHLGHTFLMFGAICFVAGMIFTLWLDYEYRKEQQERRENDESKEFLQKR